MRLLLLGEFWKLPAIVMNGINAPKADSAGTSSAFPLIALIIQTVILDSNVAKENVTPWFRLLMKADIVINGQPAQAQNNVFETSAFPCFASETRIVWWILVVIRVNASAIIKLEGARVIVISGLLVRAKINVWISSAFLSLAI